MGVYGVFLLMRMACSAWIYNVIRGLTFIAFVCLFKAIWVIFTLIEYFKECEAPSE